MTKKQRFFKSALSYEGKVLAGYKYQIDVQNILLNKIRLVLPEHLAPHALHCVISEKKLIIYTDSAAWSSQLRFFHQRILQSLSASKQSHIELVQIKVLPIVTEQKNRSSKIIPSADKIDQILSDADNQTDEKLKQALMKLGKTFQKLSN